MPISDISNTAIVNRAASFNNITRSADFIRFEAEQVEVRGLENAQQARIERAKAEKLAAEELQDEQVKAAQRLLEINAEKRVNKLSISEKSALLQLLSSDINIENQVTFTRNGGLLDNRTNQALFDIQLSETPVTPVNTASTGNNHQLTHSPLSPIALAYSIAHNSFVQGLAIYNQPDLLRSA